MPQTLGAKDSPGRCARAARRHLRLTKRGGNPEAMALASRIEAPLADLATQLGADTAAAQALDEMFDDWVLADARLDRQVKSVARKAVDHDEDHPGAGTFKLLFGTSTVSEITYARREDEPDLVVALATRGEGLPGDHRSRPLLERLVALAVASKAAHRAWVDAGTAAVKTAARVETSKLAVIGVYRDNAIDIERKCGADVADDCFPQLRSPRGGPGGDEAATT